MRKGLWAIVVASLLTACAASNISSTHVLDAKRNSGVVVGTITYVGGYGSYRLRVVELASDKATRIEHGDAHVLNPMLAFKGEPPNPALQFRGSAFAIELPAGRYALRGWQVSQGAANVWSTSDPNLEFEVKSGEAIYIGNYHFMETSRFGRAITAASVSLKDEQARDLVAVRAAFPSLAVTPVTQSIAPETKIEGIGGESRGKISFPVFIPIAR